jgi:hypothetical protein
MALWGDFSKHATANGVNCDFLGARKEIVSANLKYEGATATVLFVPSACLLGSPNTLATHFPCNTSSSAALGLPTTISH